MASNSIQLKQPLSDSVLMGSLFNQVTHKHAEHELCTGCSEILSPQSKFCGECGLAANTNLLINTNPRAQDHSLSNQYLSQQHKSVSGVPAFAEVSPQLRKPIPPELKQEYCRVNSLLLRERIFLLVHFAIFLGANLFGFYLSILAFNGFLADEVTKTVIALIPLFCINALALSALVPIKGTKHEIARLKERLTHLHYQIEYINLA